MLVDKTISKRHEVTGMLFLDDFLLAYLDLDCLFMHVLNANVSVFFFWGGSWRCKNQQCLLSGTYHLKPASVLGLKKNCRSWLAV